MPGCRACGSPATGQGVLNGILALLACQLAGEVAARGLSLSVPGPVLGMALLAVGLAASAALRRAVEPVATALLRNLSLLFVPAAVGVVQVLPQLAGQGLAIAASILVSTVAALAVTALVFRAVVRLMGEK
jgi:holin-like protein